MLPLAVDEYVTQEPLPNWVTDIRPWQTDAVERVMDAYDRGAKLVWLDAPTGAGKTLIAELVRRRLQVKRTLYVCSGLTLQDQFLHDFPYAKVLKGKTNYTPTHAEHALEEVTCGDCDKKRVGNGMECSWCERVVDCPYLVAKREAVASELAVVNTAYALREWSTPVSQLADAGLVVVDECHSLESALLGFCEFKVSGRALMGMGLRAPKKGSHHKTIHAWMEDKLIPAMKTRVKDHTQQMGLFGERDVKQARRLRRLKEQVIEAETALGRMRDGGEDSGEWIRVDQDYRDLTMKPVTVHQHGEDVLWSKGDRWLLMSATVISAGQRVGDLGVPDGWDWEEVNVPSTFDKKNRPVNYAGVAAVTYKNGQAARDKAVKAIVKLVDNHPGERVVVHSVSYDLTRDIATAIVMECKGDRAVLTYSNADGREGAIRKFRAHEGAVLVAPSVETGVDFKDDECRVQIIAKVPFPSFGDKMVGARVNGTKGGQTWYAMRTVETIVQACGRGVRHSDDWCVTYIVDSSFKDLYGRNRKLFPEWFREAVDFRFNKREAGLT